MNFSLTIGVKGLPQIGTWRKGGLIMKRRKQPVAAVVLISVVVAAATSITKNVNVNVTGVNFNLGNPPKAPPGEK